MITPSFDQTLIARVATGLYNMQLGNADDGLGPRMGERRQWHRRRPRQPVVCPRLRRPWPTPTWRPWSSRTSTSPSLPAQSPMPSPIVARHLGSRRSAGAEKGADGPVDAEHVLPTAGLPADIRTTVQYCHRVQRPDHRRCRIRPDRRLPSTCRSTSPRAWKARSSHPGDNRSRRRRRHAPDRRPGRPHRLHRQRQPDPWSGPRR